MNHFSDRCELSDSNDTWGLRAQYQGRNHRHRRVPRRSHIQEEKTEENRMKWDRSKHVTLLWGGGLWRTWNNTRAKATARLKIKREKVVLWPNQRWLENTTMRFLRRLPLDIFDGFFATNLNDKFKFAKSLPIFTGHHRVSSFSSVGGTLYTSRQKHANSFCLTSLLGNKFCSTVESLNCQTFHCKVFFLLNRTLLVVSHIRYKILKLKGNERK